MTAASLIRLDSTLDIDLSQGSLSKAGVAFTDVTNLLDAGGQPFALNSSDPEGISLTNDGLCLFL